MTQPTFSPIPAEDEVRPGYRPAPAHPWVAGRPGELILARPGAEAPAGDPRAAGRGVPGPDQGYVLRLAEHIEGRLVLEAGERADDVLAGAVALAMRRAALFGRAPVTADLEVALGLFGFLAPAPPGLVQARRALFGGLGHDEWRRRALANGVDEVALRRRASDAAAHPLGDDQLSRLAVA